MSGPVKGRADYLELGDWNAACSMCGRKRKASTLVRNWQGLYRCAEHNEERQPQDFVRGVKDNMSVPWIQDEITSYVQIPATFPLQAQPSILVLTLTAFDLQTEFTADVILTESGVDITTEVAYEGFASAVVPGWVTAVSWLWSWVSGGTNILINNPTSQTTAFQTHTHPSSGIAQCVGTSSLGAVAVVTVSVTA